MTWSLTATVPSGAPVGVTPVAVFTTTIGSLWETLTFNGVAGPAIIYVGLAGAKASAEIVPFPIREEIANELLRAAS